MSVGGTAQYSHRKLRPLSYSCGAPRQGHFGAKWPSFPPSEEPAMSKPRDTKRDTKKKPAKSLMEKRAAKREKKAANKGFLV